jgi:hypothetical protein
MHTKVICLDHFILINHLFINISNVSLTHFQTKCFTNYSFGSRKYKIENVTMCAKKSVGLIYLI